MIFVTTVLVLVSATTVGGSVIDNCCSVTAKSNYMEYTPSGAPAQQQHQGPVHERTTIVVHCKDIKGARTAHEVNSPNNQPQFS